MDTPKVLAWLQGSLALGTRVMTSLQARAEALPGFGFHETMSGTLQRPGEAERKLVFQLDASAPQLLGYLRDGRTAVSGQIAIDGLAQAAPLAGSLWIWPHRSIIRYEFSFMTDAGQRLTLSGQKDVRLLALQRTMTTLPAELRTDDGQLFGRATVYFAMADLPAFMRSFHPVHAARPPGESSPAAAPPPPPEPINHAISAL